MLERFHLPSERPHLFAEAQRLLYSVSPELQSHFLAVQNHLRRAPAGAGRMPPGRGRWAGAAARGLSRARPRRRHAVDVLLCGTWRWERPQENEMLARLLRSLLQRELTVLCLVHKRSSLYRRLARMVEQERLPGRVTFLDPVGVTGRLDARYGMGMARNQALRDIARVGEVLDAAGLSVDPQALPGFEWDAGLRLAWKAWEPYIDFSFALVRCHWLPLCSAVARTAIARGRRVVAFQQGVVSHSIDAPVMAHEYVCFGSPSADVLSAMDRGLAAATGRAVVCRRYHAVGSLFDPIVEAGGFDRRTLLFFDQATDWALDYYGLEAQHEASRRLLLRLLEECPELHRLVVRPHPANPSHRWGELAALFPERVVISTAPLAEDLRRSSVALSLFSGGTITAAASGLPAYFLTAPGGFRTPDLDSFTERHVVDEAEAFGTIGALLRDEGTYREVRRSSLQAAREYYAGGRACDFTALVDRILAGRVSPSMPAEHT